MMGDSQSPTALAEAAARPTQEFPEPPLPEGFSLMDPEGDPMGAAMAISEAFGGPEPEKTGEDVPMPADPTGDESISLPGGVVEPDRSVSRSARVRELTGEDEEALSRALNSENRARYIEVLLECGVEMIGTHRIKEDPTVLDGLILGDRDVLVKGIRQVTYGDTIDASVDCSCGVTSKIRVDLNDDVEVKPLPWDAAEVYHEIELRKGVAIVRLANGADQRECFSLPTTATLPEINSVLLSRCVQSINGEPVHNSLTAVRRLGAADRATILEWMTTNQPGPRYEEVKHKCSSCGKEEPLGMTAADLFPL